MRDCASSLRSSASSSLLFNIVQPVEITTSPPPTCTTGNEIPKNARICVPIKNETISNKKLFRAIRQESITRAGLEELRVSIRNIGLFPSGFTIGNKAPSIRIVLPIISFTRSSTGPDVRSISLVLFHLRCVLPDVALDKFTEIFQVALVIALSSDVHDEELNGYGIWP